MKTGRLQMPLVPIAMSIAKRLASRFGLTDMLARVHRPELEQSLLRVAIGGMVLIYLIFNGYRDGKITDEEASVLSVAIGFFLFSIALTAQILTSHSVSVARRFLGMVADNGVTSYCLIQTGEPGAVIIGVYLFITFGNGFRYGRAYLHACQVMSLVGFHARSSNERLLAPGNVTQHWHRPLHSSASRSTSVYLQNVSPKPRSVRTRRIRRKAALSQT